MDSLVSGQTFASSGNLTSDCYYGEAGTRIHHGVSLQDILIVQLKVTCVVLVHNGTKLNDVDVVASFMSDIGLKLADKIHTHRETTKCAFISTEESEDHPAQVMDEYNFNCKLHYSCFPENKKILNQNGKTIELKVFYPEVLEKRELLRFTRKKSFVVGIKKGFLMKRRAGTVNESITYSGVICELLDTLATFLNFEYELREPEDGMFGAVNENGTWSGLIGELIEQKINFSAATIAMAENRSDVVDFMMPFIEDHLRIAVKFPEENENMMFFNIFDNNVWLLILGATIICSVSMTLFQVNLKKLLKPESVAEMKFLKLSKRSKHSLNKEFPFLQLIGYLINQGSHQPPYNSASRSFLSCYWIFTITIVAIFSGNFMAYMTVTKLRLPINNLHELAAKSGYQATIPGGGATQQFFQNNKQQVYRDVWEERINVNSKNLYSDNESFMKTLSRVQREKIVVIANFRTILQALKDNEFCDIAISKHRFHQLSYAFAAQKGFPYLDMFNRGIVAIMEAGLLEKWLTVYFNGDDGDKCDKSLTHVRHKKTSLDHTSGAFFAFTIGIIASFIVFLVEVTVYNIRNMIVNWSVSVIRLFEHK